jgi:branched-chain amino acid transport system substrate-binding protein
LVILGTLIRETVLVMNEARKEGFIADFVGTSAVYSQLVLGQGGKNVEGLYGVSTISYPYSNDASKLVRDWIVDYRAKFNEEASAFSVYGYYIMDIFTKAAARAGPNLTVETINSAMESTTFPRDMFGAPEFHISPSDRLGTRRVRISQVQSGRWVSVTALLDPPSPLPAPG